MKRLPSREWLDDPSLPGEAMAANLADIARVDRAWRGAETLARWLAGRGLSRNGGPRPRILDLGAGSSAVSGRLREALAKDGVSAEVFALDLQWRHLRTGAGHVPSTAADALRLPLADASVDWIVSTLFLHHFSPDELVRLLGETRRVARGGFAFLDLRRHRIPLAFLAVAGRFVFDSPVTVHDAPASVRQAYTPAELEAIAARAGTPASVRRLFPFRLLVTWDRRAGA